MDRAVDLFRALWFSDYRQPFKDESPAHRRVYRSILREARFSHSAGICRFLQHICRIVFYLSAPRLRRRLALRALLDLPCDIHVQLLPADR